MLCNSLKDVAPLWDMFCRYIPRLVHYIFPRQYAEESKD